MIKLIKNVLASRQTKQAQKRRLDNNHKQLKLIYQGLEDRGY